MPFQEGEIVFPDNPEKGDIYIAPNGKAFQWDGNTWVVYELPPEWKDIRNKPYVFPVDRATTETLGGIIVGRNLTIDGDGTLNAIGGGGSSDWNDITNKPSTFPPPVADGVTLGGVKVGKNLSISADGTLDAADARSVQWDLIDGKPIEFPPVIANQFRVGGVKQGANITILDDGTISASGGGGGNADPINDWPRLDPNNAVTQFTLAGLNQAGMDVAMTVDETVGAALSNATYRRNLINDGDFYQIFPGLNGVSLAIQSMSWTGKARLLMSGVEVKPTFPLVADAVFRLGYYASATVKKAYSDIPFASAINCSYDRNKQVVVISANNDDPQTLDVQVYLVGYIRTPVQPLPPAPPPILDRAIPMNGGFRFYYHPPQGAIREGITTMGFTCTDETDEGTTWFHYCADEPWRALQVGIDEEVDPMVSTGAIKKLLRGPRGPMPMFKLPRNGGFVNGKAYTWTPVSQGPQWQWGPEGKPFTIAPDAKAITHQGDVYEWDKQGDTYNVRMNLPDGVTPNDVQGVMYYILFYDDKLDPPWMNIVGTMVYGAAKMVRGVDVVEAIFTMPKVPSSWKKIFWLSLENEHGSSPDTQWQFDPTPKPIIVGPRIKTLDFTTDGIYVSWEMPDPKEVVFWSSVMIEGAMLPEPIEKWFEGNPGEWEDYFYHTFPEGEYTVTVTCYGFNGHTKASDFRTVDVYSGDPLAPPIFTKIMPTFRGVMAFLRPTPNVDIDRVDSFRITVEDEAGNMNVAYVYPDSRWVDIGGIDDEGYPYAPTTEREATINLEPEKDYWISGQTLATDGTRGPEGAKVKFNTANDAPQGRIIVDEWDYDKKNNLFKMSGHLSTLSAHTVLNIYAHVLLYKGPLDDVDRLEAVEQITRVQNWQLFEDELFLEFEFDHIPDDETHFLIFFHYETDLGYSPISWPINDTGEYGDMPADPLPPKITNIDIQPKKLVVSFEPQSPDPANQDFFGYGGTLKDQNGNVVYAGPGEPGFTFSWTPNRILPGGKYSLWLDARGWNGNAATYVQITVPDTGAPNPPEITSAQAIGYDAWSITWSTDAKPEQIDFFMVNYTWPSGTVASEKVAADQRSFKKFPVYDGNYTVTVSVSANGISSMDSKAVTVNVPRYIPPPPYFKTAVQKPGYQIELTWQPPQGRYTGFVAYIIPPGGGEVRRDFPGNVTTATTYIYNIPGDYYIRMATRDADVESERTAVVKLTMKQE